MGDIIRIDEFQVKIDRETVMNLIDCKKDNPIYEEVTEEYEEMEPKIYELIEAVGLIKTSAAVAEMESDSVKAGDRIMYVMTTVGRKVSEYSTSLFAEGNYLGGMIADAMADSYLFGMEQTLQETLKEICASEKAGISKRLEAPHDLPMKVQEVMFRELNADTQLGMRISSGYMFDPVKTACQVLVLTQDEGVFRTQHDCRKCTCYHCKLRNIPPVLVEVQDGKETFCIECQEGESILSALMRKKEGYQAVCGGRGSCGKCKIRLKKGVLNVTAGDERILKKEELEEGIRLSCLAYPEENCEIELLFSDEKEFEVLTETGQEKRNDIHGSDETFGIAIDIGTTTIAMHLIGRQTKEIYQSFSAINRQRAYGADVISRIQASNDGEKEALQKLIRKELRDGIKEIVKDIQAEKVVNIVIAGNTTMIHLLMGYSCETLGIFPFTPVNLDTINGTYAEVLGGKELDCPVVVFPGISAFVGGDIVAGLYNCGFSRAEEVTLLVDLGTNGEMAIGNCNKILSTSTAAGPAFEGGNIRWGTGSIKGAISGVTIRGGETQIETIGDKKPVGICGTGVIEAVAELVREELVDETGLLDEAYFDEGYPLGKTENGEIVVFTQKDVREIQLAKAAVRAGIETLILRYGVTYDTVDKVYLAGGFGFHIDCEKAIQIGMLPEEFRGKIETAGNSSLGGAGKYLTEKDASLEVQEMLAVSEEINLSHDKEFNNFYMEYMYFE